MIYNIRLAGVGCCPVIAVVPLSIIITSMSRLLCTAFISGGTKIYPVEAGEIAMEAGSLKAVNIVMIGVALFIENGEIQINPSICDGCGVCAEPPVCPFNAIEVKK